MKLRVFIITNKNWGSSPDIVTIKDVQDMATVLGLDPYRVERRHDPQLGFYYGKTRVAEARVLRGELRTDVAIAEGETVLVLENGIALTFEDLRESEAYKVIHATGKEMDWAAGQLLPKNKDAGQETHN